MIDIKPLVTEKIKHLARTELSFNKSIRTLPLIVITETENVNLENYEGTERTSRVTLQLDVYAQSVQEAGEISEKVSEILTACGLRRIFLQMITDEDKPRCCMRFTCGVENVSGYIYDTVERR